MYRLIVCYSDIFISQHLISIHDFQRYTMDMAVVFLWVLISKLKQYDTSQHCNFLT